MKPTKLLVIDDNPDVREVTALLLGDLGYEVRTADSGPAALGQLEIDSSIELLIIDFAMPGMSGPELLKAVRARRPEVSAIFVTGYADYVRLQGEFAGEPVITKPFTMDQLAAAIRKAVEP